MNDLISVIVPVYGVENLLPRCLDSICMQTYKELDIILVDDSSPDNCGKICDEYAEKDSRIRVIHQKNTGVAGARNAGVSIAKGAYIGFVDSDDHIAPDMYEILMKQIKEEDADVAICGRCLEYDSGEKVTMFTFPEKKVFDSHEAIKRFLLSDGFDSAVWDKLYRRNLWEDIEFPAYYISEDVPVVARILLKSNRIVHCGCPLCFYNQREGSRSHTTFNDKTRGLDIFYRSVNKDVKEKYADLDEEADYFYYKSLLILLFRYVASKEKHPVGKECLKNIRRNIGRICKNRYIKKKYKLFALASAVGIGKMAFGISECFKINDNSLVK